MQSLDHQVIYSQKALLKNYCSTVNIRTGEVIYHRKKSRRIKVTIFYNCTKFFDKCYFGWFIGEDDEIYLVHKKYIEPLEEKTKVNYKKIMKNRKRHFYNE